MSANRLLLLTPPLLQPNCPYPATMHLTGFLAERGFDVHQREAHFKGDLFRSRFDIAGERVLHAFLNHPYIYFGNYASRHRGDILGPQ